ncbi:MAG TPA: SDR family NAD(P)-dependent oxidoreductase [Myxococcales bacterium]|nr:SDR family NAD(P)-dependent oxidoreductase [Myxococcales bacterium]
MKTVLITGATSGLGLSTAKALAGQGVRVLVGARKMPLAESVAAELRALGSPEAAPVELSLGSFADVRAGAARVKQALAGAPLDGLDCNAGLQQVAATRRTPDGFEETFAVNHLAHLLLLCLLWDELAGGRVLFIGSGTHDLAQVKGAFGFRGAQWLGVAAAARGDTVPGTAQDQAGKDRYANSKLANIVSAFELARRLKPAELVALALDPGLMGGTGLSRDHGLLERVSFAALQWLVPLMPGGSSPARSGAVAAYMLTDPELASRSGTYLDSRRHEAAASAQARDPALARALLDDSLALLGLGASELPRALRGPAAPG